MSINADRVLEAVNICIKAVPQLDISEQLRDIEEELIKDMQETITFLEARTDKELYQLSQVFEELSIEFQSQKFVDFLKELSKKHPKADMNTDIEIAQMVIED